MTTVVLDTNLLILLVAGKASRAYIGTHKRLRSFTSNDYDLLLSILNNASQICVTPNTLTETSNLLRQIGEPARSDIFHNFVDIINSLDEFYIGSRIGAQQEEFMRLGLTDSILLLLSSNESSILVSMDLHLCLAAQERGLRVQNFNHLRQFNSF